MPLSTNPNLLGVVTFALKSASIEHYVEVYAYEPTKAICFETIANQHEEN